MFREREWGKGMGNKEKGDTKTGKITENKADKFGLLS